MISRANIPKTSGFLVREINRTWVLSGKCWFFVLVNNLRDRIGSGKALEAINTSRHLARNQTKGFRIYINRIN